MPRTPLASLRINRRRALAAAAAATVGPWLAACASPSATGASATPSPAVTKTVLVFQPWQLAYGFQSLGSAVNELMYEATQPFRDKHPSIDLKMYGPQTNPVAATIAGAGPDVPQLQGGGGGIDGWLAGSLLLDLTPYIRKNNVDMSAFAAGQVATVTTDAGIFGLPNYMGTAAIVVNYSVLDTLGLAYPDQNWDYKAYAKFCRSVAGPLPKNGWRYGTTLDWSEYGPDAFYFNGFGGNIVDPTNPARCALDGQAAIDAGNYLYGMIWDKSARTGRVDATRFLRGEEVAPMAWVQQMLQWVTVWKGFKWDFYPMPTWPKGDYSMTNPNYFAINAATKEPDAAWELLQWLCAGPDWQRAMMKIVLLPPGYLPIWPEWLTIVRQVAPPLAHKNLEVFSAMVEKGHPIQVDGAHFKYADAQAKQLLQPWTDRLTARKLTVEAAFPQAANQITAFEAAAAREVAGGGKYAQAAKSVVAGLPDQLKQLPGLFPGGGRQP